MKFIFIDIGVINSGFDYTSEPLVYLYPTPKTGYTRQNVMNLDITDAKFKTTISEGGIQSIHIDNIGNNFIIYCERLYKKIN